MRMKGISFIIDEKGRKRAAVVDLEEHLQAWEDFYDNLVAESRKREKRHNWSDVRSTTKKATSH
jgi:hypothetical protein